MLDEEGPGKFVNKLGQNWAALNIDPRGIKKFKSVSRGQVTVNLTLESLTMIHQSKICTPFTVIY